MDWGINIGWALSKSLNILLGYQLIATLYQKIALLGYRMIYLQELTDVSLILKKCVIISDSKILEF
jgi:hypothetical protein